MWRMPGGPILSFDAADAGKETAVSTAREGATGAMGTEASAACGSEGCCGAVGADEDEWRGEGEGEGKGVGSTEDLGTKGVEIAVGGIPV